MIRLEAPRHKKPQVKASPNNKEKPQIHTDTRRWDKGGPSYVLGAGSPRLRLPCNPAGCKGVLRQGLGSKPAWTRPLSCPRADCWGCDRLTVVLSNFLTLLGLPLPQQASREWARKGLRSSLLEEQVPTEAHPAGMSAGTRSVSATSGPQHGPEVPIHRQPSVCIRVHPWFDEVLSHQLPVRHSEAAMA